MGRPELEIPEPGSALGRLATYLREIKRRKGFTYERLEALTGVSVSTLSRAAGGKELPTLDVAVIFHRKCAGAEDVRELWKHARNEVRPRRTGPRAKPLHLVRSPAEFSAALSQAYLEGEAHSVRDLVRRAEETERELVPLPRSTADRLIRGESIPTSKEQLLAFLRACGVPRRKHRQWVATWKEVQDQYKEHREASEEDQEIARFFDYFTAHSAAVRMREGGFEPLEAYRGAYNPWTSRCLECRQVVRVRFSDVFLRKGQCVACSQGRRAPLTHWRAQELQAQPGPLTSEVTVPTGSTRFQRTLLDWDVPRS